MVLKIEVLLGHIDLGTDVLKKTVSGDVTLNRLTVSLKKFRFEFLQLVLLSFTVSQLFLS
jgi:hypothetical protein